MTLELIRRLCDHATDRPRAEALRELGGEGGTDRVMTYSELRRAVLALGLRIRDDFPPGAVVMICYPNQLECIVAFLGVICAGATAFPIHPKLADSELLAASKHARAVAVMGVPHVLDVLRSAGLTALECHDLVPEPQALACANAAASFDVDVSSAARLLLQSSGTTGTPKIVERSGSSLDAVARNVATSVRLTPADRVLGLVPACHSYGVENVLVGPIWAGCCVHLCRKLDARMVMDQLVSGGITVLPGVPSMFEMLAQLGSAPGPLVTLRCAYSAGSPLPLAVFEAFEQRFGVRIGQLFGMTELGSVTFNDPHAAGHDPASVGRPMKDVDVLIVDPDTKRLDAPLGPGDEGEVVFSAPSMLTGYLREEDAVCEQPSAMQNGYFFTGDLGRLDGQGNLTITGRLKLVIDVGGHKVNVLEVERVLCTHPAVRECLVMPVRVSETVLRLKALIVGQNPDEEIPINALRNHLRTHLSAHKIPRILEVVESLPRSATGKVRRLPL
ncbi:MAG: acyl--CoA ligase [Planctomycetes bacterium]|nr:acyl--CoA ligase [Planctomycetota bacterium]